MPFDDLYKKLNKPAPDAFPKFEEESWKKMELLLDKHLPEKKRRFFPYLLFFGCVIVASLTTFLPAERSTQLEEGSLSNAKNSTSKPIPVIEKSEFELEVTQNHFAPRCQAEFCHRQKVKMQIPKEERRVS